MTVVDLNGYYWAKQFDRAGDMVQDFVDAALDRGVEPDALIMWLLNEACELQRNIEGNKAAARKTVINEVRDIFAMGPF